MARKKNPKYDDSYSFDQEELKLDQATAKRIDLRNVKIEVNTKSENQKKFIESINKNQVTIGSGFAGCGKTFLSCVEAIRLMKTGKYEKIVLVKSVTTLEGEDIGYLKGDMAEKMAPFMYSFRYHFRNIIGDALTKKMEEDGRIEIVPLAYIRGVEFKNCLTGDQLIKLSDDTYITIEEMCRRLGTEDFNVLSYDIENEEIQEKPVVAFTASMPVEDIYEIELEDGSTLKLTGDHELYVYGKGYVKVQDLTEDDLLSKIED